MEHCQRTCCWLSDQVHCFRLLRKRNIDLETQVLYTNSSEADPNALLSDLVQFTAGMLVGALLDQISTCKLEVEGNLTLVRWRNVLGEPLIGHDGCPVCVCMHMQASCKALFCCQSEPSV